MDVNNVGRKSRKSCCIVGCSNRIANTEKEVVFYSFPGRPHERELCSRWVQAVNRKNLDGSQWIPTKKSFICSQHFDGGKKSSHPLNPSYVPTIFPEEYKIAPLTDAQKNRFERNQKRKRRPTEINDVEVVEAYLEDCHLKDGHPEDSRPNTRNVSTQTDPIVFISPKEDQDTSNYRGLNLLQKPKMVDKSVSAVPPTNNQDFFHCSGFHGHSSLVQDETGTAIMDLAGITMNVFMLLLSLMPIADHRKVSKENKLLIFLMKMKLGLTFSSIRVLFGIHRTTVSKIFKTVLGNLRDATHNFVFWPSRSAIVRTMPEAFKAHYPNCRVIIDCSEVKVSQPKEADFRIAMYSNYKSGFTMKFLIGISPSGMVTYISKCYGGRSSDSSITVDGAELLTLLEPGDEVMADKGFPGIKTTMEDKHIVIVMPPFLHNGRFSEEEVQETYNVASVRIHVERMIQRVKIYNILDKITVELFPYVDDIVRMCCVLANLQLPIIKDNN